MLETNFCFQTQNIDGCVMQYCRCMCVSLTFGTAQRSTACAEPVGRHVFSQRVADSLKKKMKNRDETVR